MFRLRPLLLTAPLAICVSAAVAEEKTYNVEIPAQSLATALETLAKQTGIKPFYNDSLVAGKKSPAVFGLLSPRAALEQLLAGSGLSYKFNDNQAVAITQREESLNKNEITTLPKVTVVGSAAYDSYDPYNQDYALPDASTATKTDTPISETPFSVQVVSKQVLKDQQVISLDQALKNVSGITTGGGGGNGAGQSFQNVLMRGFSTDTHFRNGVRLDSFGGDNGTNTLQFANVERVEVLKGPAAILYGGAEPGGAVNVVTKQPLDKPYYSAQQQFGSYDTYRTSFDASGPVSSDNTLLYRVNASVQTNNSIVDYVHNQSYFFAPIIKWNISSRTQATIELEYKNLTFDQNFGFLPEVNSNPVFSNRSLNYGGSSPAHEQSYLAGFGFSHQFNDDWKIKHQFLYNTVGDSDAFLFPNAIQSGAPTPSGFAVVRDLIPLNHIASTYSNNLDLTGNFNTGFIKHTLLFGGNSIHFDASTQQNQAGFTDPTNVSFIDVFNPIQPGTPFTSAVSPSGSNRQINDTYGVYLQDQLKLPGDVHVLGGFRYENISQRPFQSAFGAPFSTIQPTPAFFRDVILPRVGLLWKPQEWLSLYGNYTTNIGPNNAASSFGISLPPSAGRQFEIGAKAEAFDGRLRATVAHYTLTKTNIPTGFFPNIGVVGEARSVGWEFDVQGELAPGWNIIANYSNTSAKVTKGNNGDFLSPPVGAQLGEVPIDLAHLFTTYEFSSGDLNGLKVGGGATFNGSAPALDQGFDPNYPNLKIPGYITVDLLTSYSLKVLGKKFTAQINATNILDKTYFSDLQTPGFAGAGPFTAITGLYGAPRTILGSIKVEF